MERRVAAVVRWASARIEGRVTRAEFIRPPAGLMPRAADDLSADWERDARERSNVRGLGVQQETQDSPGRTWRLWLSVVLFMTAYGLTLWHAGFGPPVPESAKTPVVIGYIVAYVALAMVVYLQYRNRDILSFHHEGRGERTELTCFGIKWSKLFGYIFTLFTSGLIVTLGLWVANQIKGCGHKHGNGVNEKDLSQDCLRNSIGNSSLEVSGAFALLAVVFGVREIWKHWSNYYQRRKQRHIVRVLIMVPIYALDALLTLYLCFGRAEEQDGIKHRVGCQGEHNYQVRLILETIRELYEAYTIYSFFTYLVECLHDAAVREDEAAEDHGPAGELARMQRNAAPAASPINAPLLPGVEHPQGVSIARHSIVAALGLSSEDKMYACLNRHNPNGQPHPWWSGVKCCMREWQMGKEWLEKCWSGVLLYVVVEVLFAVVLLITRTVGRYGEGCLFPWSECKPNHPGEYGYQYAYTYLTFIVSLAQMYALYCLFMFYHATSTPLKDIYPKAKFISIKAIVFLTYWQGIGLGVAQSLDAHFKSGVFQAIAVFVGLCDEEAPQAHWLNAECKKEENAHAQESLSTGIQAVLICVEMFGAALVHRTVFSYRDYRRRDTDEPEMGFWSAVKHSFDPRIVYQQAADLTGARRVGSWMDAVTGAVRNVEETVSDRWHGGDRLET